MRFLQAIAAAYLLLLAGFVGGAFVVQTRVWPFQYIRDIYRFVQGYQDEHTSIFQKLMSDTGVRPDRFLHPFTPNASENFQDVAGLPLSNRRTTPVLSVAGGIRDGYIYIVGKFDFDDAMNGVLLMTTSGKIVRYWKIPNSEIKDGHHHLFTFRHDGSFVSGADYAPIYHIDACGKWLGSIYGEFHHSISEIDDSRYYVPGSLDNKDAFSIININTMKIERSVPLTQVHDAADPDLDIFGLWITRKDAEDIWHINDVEPFPATAKSDRFKPGDLLISYRHSDLVYVIDPNTLQLKWWSQSYTAGQHDPDWQPDGTITVYNNRLYKPGHYSTIVQFDFQSPKPKVIFDGRKYDFYGSIGGKHTILDDGSLLLSSYDEGRALWVDKDGRILFDFVNRYSKNEALIVLDAGYLPPDYFGKDGLPACK